MNWQALWLTLQLASVVVVILLLLSLPLAYWLAFSAARWKFLAEAVVALPLVLPPTVLGFYLLIAFGQNGFVGAFWAKWTGHPLAFTFQSLVIGSVIYSLPFAVQPITSALRAVDLRLIQAAQVLGSSGSRTFFRVLLPLSRNGLLTAATLSFAHTLGEFGVVLMVGGNIPGHTRTVSIDIYDRVQALDYASAHAMAATLLILSFVLLSLVYGLTKKTWTIVA